MADRVRSTYNGMDHPGRPIWLATVGLGEELGGVAHVARSCLAALRAEPRDTGHGTACWNLDRVVGLLDPSMPAVDLGGLAPQCVKLARTSRLRFLSLVAGQLVCRPALILYDHVDLAQSQLLLPRQFRTPHVIWIHGIEVWKQLPKRKLSALKAARLLIFNSRFTRQKFESFHGSGFPSRVVPLALDCPPDLDEAGLGPRSSSSGEPVDRAPRRPWMLTVGRLEPDRPKGHRQILLCMRELIQAVPELQWHVVGKGRDLEPFRREVAASGCADRISLHGFLEKTELRRLYRQCRVLAMPSCGEGFGLVYLEAMSHGCVPLGSTLDAAAEVIGDGGTCVDLDDPGALFLELQRLLTQSSEQFARQSQRALSRAGQFSQARFAANLISTLDQAVAPQRGV
jgi:phosphatidylinositol alpha-1,6-mannosyltransferase